MSAIKVPLIAGGICKSRRLSSRRESKVFDTFVIDRELGPMVGLSIVFSATSVLMKLVN